MLFPYVMYFLKALKPETCSAESQRKLDGRFSACFVKLVTGL